MKWNVSQLSVHRPHYADINTGLEMDVRKLEFVDGSFDVVIDKGMPLQPFPYVFKLNSVGTMDAMLAYKGDVWVSSLNSIMRFTLINQYRTHQHLS